jgi:ABC-type ATPase involved in cell division
MNEAQLAHWRRTEIGLVFQQFNLIGSLRVEDNLAFQARLAGRMMPVGRRIWCSAWAWGVAQAISGTTCPAASSNGWRWGVRWRRAHLAVGRRAHRQPRRSHQR